MPERSADHRTGGGEPSRTLALLWRHHATATVHRKGPSRSLDVDDVVDAALALADDAGLAALTMRAVADRLGVSTMSVYTYVPGKAELLDVMVDTLYLRMDRPAWASPAWRDRASAVAAANLTLLTAHPWLSEVAALRRPPLGPGLMAKYDHELAVFDHTGVDDVDRDASLTFLLGFVAGHARDAREAGDTRATTTDAQWWAANQPALARALDPDAYPLAVRVGGAAGESQGAAWEAERAWMFGLARVLDGLGVLLDA